MHVLGKRVPQDARKYCDLIQELGADAGCQFLKLGPSSTILRHQAEEGFAHVEEQTLEEIHDKILKIPKPVADDGACRKDELALSLMKKLTFIIFLMVKDSLHTQSKDLLEAE